MIVFGIPRLWINPENRDCTISRPFRFYDHGSWGSWPLPKIWEPKGCSDGFHLLNAVETQVLEFTASARLRCGFCDCHRGCSKSNCLLYKHSGLLKSAAAGVRTYNMCNYNILYKLQHFFCAMHAKPQLFHTCANSSGYICMHAFTCIYHCKQYLQSIYICICMYLHIFTYLSYIYNMSGHISDVIPTLHLKMDSHFQ